MCGQIDGSLGEDRSELHFKKKCGEREAQCRCKSFLKSWWSLEDSERTISEGGRTDSRRELDGVKGVLLSSLQQSSSSYTTSFLVCSTQGAPISMSLHSSDYPSPAAQARPSSPSLPSSPSSPPLSTSSSSGLPSSQTR